VVLSRPYCCLILVKFDTLSIVIPVYNEARTIHQILDLLRELELLHNIRKGIILVNDCSTDASADTIRAYAARYPALGLRLLEHAVNQGKGAALSTGIREATGDYVIIQDADLEYDPEEYNLLIKPILKGFADVVFGSRFMGGNPHRILFFWHSIGNDILTFLSNMCTDLNLTDTETCYKLFRREAGRKAFRLRARGDGQGGARAPYPGLRGRYQLLRPHLRRGQENWLARRLPRHLLHPQGRLAEGVAPPGGWQGSYPLL